MTRKPKIREGGRDSEKAAFMHVVVSHGRDGIYACEGGCKLPLGASFAAHMWDEFVKARAGEVRP